MSAKSGSKESPSIDSKLTEIDEGMTRISELRKGFGGIRMSVDEDADKRTIFSAEGDEMSAQGVCQNASKQKSATEADKLEMISPEIRLPEKTEKHDSCVENPGSDPDIDQIESYVHSNEESTKAQTSRPSNPFEVKYLKDRNGFPCFDWDEYMSRFPFAFGNCIVGKFTNVSPKLGEIKNAMIRMGRLDGEIEVESLEARHVIIKFALDADFRKVWCKSRWTINGTLMRSFRWSPDFSPNSEPTTAPIWIAFPRLRLQYYHPYAFMSIASIFGNFICADKCVVNLTRFDNARACVEVDISMPIPAYFRIRNGDENITQYVVVQNLPPFCSICAMIGHGKEVCRKKGIIRGMKKENKALAEDGTDEALQLNEEAFTDREKGFKVIKWYPPTVDEIKLNTDGASKGDPGKAGGGDILRDHDGNMIVAFSKFYQNATSMEAECRALADGLKLCEKLGLMKVCVEVDSLQLVNMVKDQICTESLLEQWWAVIMEQHMRITRITHQFREGNYLADLLANRGVYRGKCMEYWSPKDLPMKEQRVLWSEKGGFNYVRLI